jgi:hypothetical protein
MSETKTKFNEEHFAKHYSKEIQRITAVIHLNELASKNQIIHDWLLDFHAEVLEFANNCGIKVSKINSNDIINTLHDRTNGPIHDGGNGIMADL